VAPAEHREHIYSTTSRTELSWYEAEPATSFQLVEAAARGPETSVIDVGGGTSSLVELLLASDYTDVTVIDVSRQALETVRERLGRRAQLARWVHHEVLTWEPDRRYDIWHDRAVFHFLTDPAARARYVEVVDHAVEPDGGLVIGTFAEDGPTHCSGLPVCRYSHAELEHVFSASFTLVTEERTAHVTPRGVVQPFTWVVLRRR
jgi:2-polyprenyl-3-methyl-5-hydroxy-6-metoxy-1,4-benzoquinol methylase